MVGMLARRNSLFSQQIYYYLSYYSAPSNLTTARTNLASASIGDYVLFAGGNNGTTRHATVDAYNTSLSRSTPTALSVGRSNLSATTVGTYALFAGGINTTTFTRLATVDAYNTSLVRSTPTALIEGTDSMASTTIGQYALFAGGTKSGSSYTSTVVSYDTTLVRSTPTSLSVGRTRAGGASTNSHALFVGGSANTGLVDTVDAYNMSLTRSTPTVAPIVTAPIGISSQHLAIFVSSSSTFTYDIKLRRSLSTPLSVQRASAAGSLNGDFAVIAGGSYGGVNYSTVDAYKINIS